MRESQIVEVSNSDVVLVHFSDVGSGPSSLFGSAFVFDRVDEVPDLEVVEEGVILYISVVEPGLNRMGRT